VIRWYDDEALVRDLPRRYRAYALYSRLVGESNSRRVTGGSFLLRLIKDVSSLTGGSTIARVRGIDGLTVVTDFADERVLEVIHEIRGENPEYRAMQSLLSEGATFVDVGANFGTFSLLASRLVGVSGKVIAIEPQAKLAEFIQESIALSNVTNCAIKPVACGRMRAERTLFVPADDSGRAGFFSGFSRRKRFASHAVKVATLDSLLEAASSPCVIKIDVEGSEMDVLDGAAQSIERLKPGVIIELNPWSAAAAGHTPKEIIDRLTSHGYSSFATAEGYPSVVSVAHIELDRQTNLIAWQ